MSIALLQKTSKNLNHPELPNIKVISEIAKKSEIHKIMASQFAHAIYMLTFLHGN